MLIVAGLFAVDPAGHDAACKVVATMMDESMKEAGCISYSFAAVLGQPGSFRVFEEWASQEALDAHSKTDHMATFKTEMGNIGINEVKLSRYEITSQGPLEV